MKRLLALALFLPVLAHAQVQINALPSASAVGGGDFTIDDQAGVTKKATFNQVAAFMGPALPSSTVPLASLVNPVAYSLIGNATGSTAAATALTAPRLSEIGIGGAPACNGYAGSGCVASQDGLITLANSAGAQGTFIMEADAVGTSVNGGVLAIISGSGSAPNGLGGSTDHYAGKGQGTGAGGSMGLLAGDALGSGAGGNLQVGSGGSVTGNAGNVVVGSGNGGGHGGDMSLTAGNGTASNALGGAITVTTGNAHGTGHGGIFTIQGGTGGATGNGGEIDIFGGNFGGGAAVGGNILMQGGISVSPANGSDILMEDNAGDNTWYVDRFGNAGGQFSTVTSATDRFLYLGSVAGVPTGVPAHLTGLNAAGAPARYDTSDNRLYVYNSGWKQVGSAAAIPLVGTTGSIGGGALLAGACASGTVAVTSSTTAMSVIATPVADPGDGATWMGFVSTNGTVTVKVCALVAVTPTATTYNVRVIQ